MRVIGPTERLRRPLGGLFETWVQALTRIAALVGCVAVVGPQSAWADSTDQAKRIHDRIAGVHPDSTTLITMRDMLDANDPIGAALVATETKEFLNVTLKNFAAPWTNRDQSVFVPLDDYTATVIGIVHEEVDFREILSGDIIYVGSGVTGYSNSSNAHYEALETQDFDLRNLERRTQSSVTGLPSDATAGVMTTRSAAKAFFIDGTNRAMFRFTMLNHLCHDMEQVLDITRAPDRIRQDVSRSPGGDSRVFMNNCIGCHSGMDPLAQAFAYYDYEYDVMNDPEGQNGQISYNEAGETDPMTGTRVESKYFNNNLNFEHGFVTPDDSWTNYWRAGQNALLGWSDQLPGFGTGAKTMGEELANSQAFAQCQVTKVFEDVCLRLPQDANDRAQIDTMVSSLQSNGYNLKRTFAESAVYCMGD
jgi:hypothetical protein